MQVDMAITEEEEVVELNVHSFDLLEMTQQQAAETQEAWEMFLQCYESIEVAGEALHDAIIDASPTLTTLFTMPRAVTSMRLQEGIHQIINSLTEPQDVKNLVAWFWVLTMCSEGIERGSIYSRCCIFHIFISASLLNGFWIR